MIWAIHGHLGHPADWEPFAAHLPEWEFACPNLWDTCPIPFREWARALNRDASADPAPVLVGYSMGARLAMHAIVESPGLWHAAILVSGHPGLTDAAERSARLIQDREWSRLLREDGSGPFREAWNRQEVLAESPVPARQIEVVRLYPGPVAEAFEVWSLGNQEDLVPRLAATRVPQLWIAGEQDQKFSRLTRDAAARIPGAAYVGIEATGHRVPLQNPAALAQCVRHFLAKPGLKGNRHVVPGSDIHRPEL